MNIPVVRFIDRRLGMPLCRWLAVLFGSRPLTPAVTGPERILVMRNFGVGNLVLMMPALSALRARFPGARIDAVTLAANRGFLERTGYFTRIWYLNDASIAGFCTSLASVFFPLRAARYDVFIDFEQFARTSAIVGLLLRIPRRIGFATPGQGREPAFTDCVPYRNDLHMLDGFYSLLGPLGVPAEVGVRPVPIPTTPGEDQAAHRLLEEARISADARVAIVHPGTSANVVLRRWPEGHFARVADYLIEEGFSVILTGIPAEADIVARVEAQMQQRAFNAVGRLSLGGLLALLRRAALVISNDTGPIHLAAAQGAPVIGLYGPNIPVLYGPRSQNGLSFYLGLPCSPCITNFNEKGSDCQNNICMKLMTADQVTAALSHIFEGKVYAPTADGGVRELPGAAAVDPRLVRRRREYKGA